MDATHTTRTEETTMTPPLRTISDLVALVEQPLLYRTAVDDVEKSLSLTSKSSPQYAEVEAELATIKARWESESEARGLRAALTAKGFRRSDYDAKIWVRKNARTGRWDKFGTEAALRFAGLVDG